MPKGQSHPKTKHENSSASYTWRPKGAETEGFMLSMTASSGPILCGGCGKKYARRSTSTERENAEQGLESRKKKVIGEPDEGKPHVRFEVAGNGNQDKAKALRHSQRKRRATGLHHLSPRRHSLTLPTDPASALFQVDNCFTGPLSSTISLLEEEECLSNDLSDCVPWPLF